MGKGVSRKISGGNMADTIANISKDKIKTYQTRLDSITDDIEERLDAYGSDREFGFENDTEDSIYADFNNSVSSLLSEVRADQELSEEDRKMMNQRIRRMRERYL